MEYTSAGRLQLANLSKQLGGYTAVARRLSGRFERAVHHTTVRGWAVGTRCPELAFAFAMEDELAIPARAWLDPVPLPRMIVVRDEDVPDYDPAVDEPAPEEVAS